MRNFRKKLFLYLALASVKIDKTSENHKCSHRKTKHTTFRRLVYQLLQPHYKRLKIDNFDKILIFIKCSRCTAKHYLLISRRARNQFTFSQFL